MPDKNSTARLLAICGADRRGLTAVPASAKIKAHRCQEMRHYLEFNPDHDNRDKRFHRALRSQHARTHTNKRSHTNKQANDHTHTQTTSLQHKYIAFTALACTLG